MKDKENALGNLGTSYHSEPFVETLKAKMKVKIFHMEVLVKLLMEYLKLKLFIRIYKMKKDFTGTIHKG